MIEGPGTLDYSVGGRSRFRHSQRRAGKIIRRLVFDFDQGSGGADIVR
jgi:hypothetical protein